MLWGTGGFNNACTLACDSLLQEKLVTLLRVEIKLLGSKVEMGLAGLLK